MPPSGLGPSASPAEDDCPLKKGSRQNYHGRGNFQTCPLPIGGDKSRNQTEVLPHTRWKTGREEDAKHLPLAVPLHNHVALFQTEELEPVKLNGIREEMRFLFRKTAEALKYLYDHHLNDFDWFYKADDDTYAILENLRYVLTPYDPEFPIGLGERAIVNGNKAMSYLQGGAGYVLSRGALKIYGNVTYHNNSLCPMNRQGGEDVLLGQCLTKSGILLGDTRDELGRHRFHQKPPVDYIQGIWQKWYPNTIIYTYGKGIDSISETAVSFHDLKDESHLYIIEYFIYRLQLFGVEGRFKGPEVAPLPPDHSAVPVEVLTRFLKPKVNESERK
ncbi:glycoprotein-N-acetylgalactosamine 3-beta-galactosyltransferase 1-like [Macrobrachium rosenbergii]|uniref:glycoprotein-N-acetylgalactosamine 3-beta-galactosyltransferase 1-like n=1 Tax=Macrobrachium rosenbergii TaxID=79674 RepID=UPI0034D3FA79